MCVHTEKGLIERLIIFVVGQDAISLMAKMRFFIALGLRVDSNLFSAKCSMNILHYQRWENGYDHIIDVMVSVDSFGIYGICFEFVGRPISSKQSLKPYIL